MAKYKEFNEAIECSRDELLDIIKTEIDHSNHFSNTVEV